MKRNLIFFIVVIFLASTIYAQNNSKKDKIIFAYGGGFNPTFINYVAKLTGKEKPKICFLPTASADSPYGIIRWYDACSELNVIPSVVRVWISSYYEKLSFEEQLLSVDAIVVGGGNTLNMMAIWKAQGIDTVLAKAYDNGIVLAGGSAGSLCWFVEGTTDSRPKKLTTVKGLGFLNYSHSPHYSSEKFRRPLYQKMIANGEFISGYAIDNKAGVVFKNGKYFKAISLSEKDKAYFVRVQDNKVVEDELKIEIIKQSH